MNLYKLILLTAGTTALHQNVMKIHFIGECIITKSAGHIKFLLLITISSNMLYNFFIVNNTETKYLIAHNISFISK